MVRLEGARVRADLQRQQNGRLHFHIAVPVEIGTDLAHDRRAAAEGLAHVRIHDEIDVPETVLHVHVLQSVVFFGQRQQGLGEHFETGGVNGPFPRLRLEDGARDANDVADVELFFIRHVHVFADVLTGDVDLDIALGVADMRKGRLAHDAAGHQPPGDRDFPALPCGKIALHLPRAGGDGELCLAIGILPLVGKLFEFFAADARLFDELLRAVDVFFHLVT